MSPNLQLWERRVREMQDCKDVPDMVARHGEPHHKVQQDGFEIWHYPLGVDAGMLYSIHASVWPDGSRQVFIFLEPTDLPDSPLQDTRWQRPAGAFALLVSFVISHLAIYRPIRAAMRHAPDADSMTILSVCVPPLLYVGLVLTLFGKRSSRILGIGQRESRMQLVIALILICVGFSLWFWVTNTVAKYSAETPTS